MAFEAASALDSLPPRRARRGPSPVVVYFAIIVLPPALFYFSLASNQTVGTFVLCTVLLICRFGRVYGADGSPAAPVTGDRAALFASALIGLHLIISGTFQPLNLPRATASLIPLGLLLIGGSSLGAMLFAIPPRSLHRGLRVCFLLLCAMAAFSVVGLVPPSSEQWRKPVFPFSEPSTFALAFIPLLLYATVTSHGSRRAAFLLIGLLCTAFIQNLTLLVGFALVALVTLRWYALVGGLALLIAVASQLDLSYYAERLDFSGETENLSNLVYLQGWQMVAESWQRSGGFGIGFQQLGIFGTEVPAAQVLRALRDGEDMNVLDGSFVFAKLGSEFGIFGCLLAIIFLWLAYRSFRVLRRAASRRSTIEPLTVLAHCTVFSYVIELLVRSAGYFTPAALLLATALCVLARRRRNEARQSAAMQAGF